MQVERRIDQRINHSLPAYIIRRGLCEPVELLEVSYRGLFLRTHSKHEVRDLVKLRIELPARELVTHGVVARVVTDPHSTVTGLGMRFFALRDHDKNVWETYVQSLVAVLALRRAA